MRKIRVFICLICALLLDQVVKLWAVSYLRVHGPIPIIKNVLELLYVENRGAAFGIFQNKQWFFALISIVVLIIIAVISHRIPADQRYQPLRICLFFICAGAIGNLIDRVIRRYVVDFIFFNFINFPVFNVADIYVTVSIFFLLLLIMFHYSEEELDGIFKKR